MLHSNLSPLFMLFLFLPFISSVLHPSAAHSSGLAARTLKGIKETPNGGNVTYDCSPSGPCIPCSRSEKNDGKYRCGETGYRIRLKCTPTESVVSKGANNLKGQKTRSVLETTDMGVNQHKTDLSSSSSRQRRLASDASKSDGASRAYITYRSCLPAINEEKLSVLGFEALMMALLLSSGSFIYFRRKRSSAVAGGAPMRLPTSSRF